MQGFRRGAVAVNAEVGSAVPDVDVEYGYDTLGRLWTVKDWKQSGSNVSTNVYDLAGVLTETWYPNTVRQKFDHTEQNRLSKVSWEQNTGSAMVARKRFTYQLNATGQRTQLDEDDGAAVLRTVKYAYDSAVSPPIIGMTGPAPNGTDVSIPTYQRVPKVGRLTEESVIYPNGSPLNADYTYDLVGNRLKRQNGTAIDAALTDQNLSFDAKDRFGSGGPVTFDANGNGVTSANNTVTDYYDAENRLVKRTAPNSVTIKLTYDHDGNRVGKQVQTGSTYLNTYYLVDDKNPTGYAQVLVEYQDTAATPNAANEGFYISYIYGQNVLWQHTASGATYYYGYDGQGSVRGIMNTSGSIVKTYSYDAWGTMLAPTTSPIDDRYLYTGQQWDKDLRMYYLRARYYSPQYGRFWTTDTYDGSQSDPLSLHKFLYCAADPIDRIDPSGHMNLTSVMFSIGTLGYVAANTYILNSYAINRALVVVYEGVSGDLIILGGGSAVGTAAALSKVEGGIGTWVKAVTDVGKNAVVGPYGYLKELLQKSGWQANHLNQSAAYKEIESSLGAAVDLVGEAWRKGTEHFQFHISLERFWGQFRKDGPRHFEQVSNKEYLAALREALQGVRSAVTGAAKYTKKQIDALVELAEKEQRGYGYHDGPGGKHPEVPSSMNLE
jgi:RHS repeat-associated protein